MRELLVGTSPVIPSDRRTIAVTDTNAAETLLHFLRELLFAFESDGFVPARFEVGRADEQHVRGVLHGERFDPTRHETQPEVKAVTRHGLWLEPLESGWRAEVVFDV